MGKNKNKNKRKIKKINKKSKKISEKPLNRKTVSILTVSQLKNSF